MIAPKPCRACGCELEMGPRIAKRGYICKSCASAQAKVRAARRKRSVANSGLTCSQCPNPICAVNKSGLCAQCSRSRNGSRTGPHQLQPLPEPHACPRCSIQTKYPVCRDCRDVLRTLGELHLWVDGLVAA